MDEKYPVLYYDTEGVDLTELMVLVQPLIDYYEKKNIKFILLPRQVKQEWITKKEMLEHLDKMRKEVESWQ